MTTQSDDQTFGRIGAMPTAPLEPAPTGERGGAGFIALLALTNLGIWFAFFTPFIFTLQVKVQQLVPENAGGALAIIVGTTSIFGLIANPFVGRLSDRTTSRFGMRRPWLLGSVLVGVVGLVLMGVSTNIPVLAIGLLIMGVGYTGALAALLALIPDHVPARRRAFASGLLGVTQAFAVILGVGVAGNLAKQSLTAAFIVPGIVGLVLVLIRVLTLKDRTLPKDAVSPFRWVDFFSSFYTNPFKHPDFGWAWISRFLLFMSFASVVNYQVFYLSQQLGIKVADTASFIQKGLGAQTLMLIIASILAGLLSDKIKRRKVFVCASAAVGALGLVLFATATTVPQYFVGIAIIGFAQGTYYAVDLALVADVLPDRDRNAAKDLGVLSIATQGPTALIPVFAPLLLAIPFGNVAGGAGSSTNYTALFLGSAVFAVGAAVAILPVRGSR